MSSSRLSALAAFCALALSVSGCKSEGCLGGEEGCRIPTPCQEVQFSCEATSLEVRVLGPGDAPPGGQNALGARGDVLIGNSRIVAVIAGIGNQNYLDPNGGSLLDLSIRGKDNDSLNQSLPVVGILPRDAPRYTRLEVIEEEGLVAVQVIGTLDDEPETRIATRYEVRPCEPGIRIRTEILNASPDPQTWALMEGFYWSGREALSFAPAKGTGFENPSFDLLTIEDAFRRYPYLAAASQAAPYASYALVGCNVETLEGFNSEQISAAGLPREIVPPRDYRVFERFLAVADSRDVAGAVNVALDLREQLFDEERIRVTGVVNRGGQSVDQERFVSLHISEGSAGDPREERIPLTQVLPDSDGRFEVQVPRRENYVVEVRSFGRIVAERDFTPAGDVTDLGEFVLPRSARVSVYVQDNLGGPLEAEVFIIPADDATRAAVQGAQPNGNYPCSPWLGPPAGASPACNRFLVSQGQAQVDVPLGRFHVYAFKGPFWTIARQTVELVAEDVFLDFAIEKLPLQPQGTVNADLHVHGPRSFDSSIPEIDRVRSFAATDLEVIAATDHEVVTDYSTAVRALGLEQTMSTITGTETTGHILFLEVPGDTLPRVIGHYNFWPIPYDPNLPRGGGPYDEYVEPGALFDQVDALTPATTPIFQLNHPWADLEFGRDLGFPRALRLDLRRDLPAEDDGTAAGIYVRAPNEGGYRNLDHHAQEVMNGTQNDLLLPYRTFWHYTLNQGQLKTGTANSDSHSLTDNTVGLPRNIVWADTRPGLSFDVERFNVAVRRGEVLGTNGPVIEATLGAPAGERVRFSLNPIAPPADATLSLRISAAPWVPIEEVRILVNGALAATIGEGELQHPDDPFGTAGLVRLEREVPLKDLLADVPTQQDAWIVIEAGQKLLPAADFGGGRGGTTDGVPDTTDNNGDGVVDASDIGEDRDYGPIKNPPLPLTDAEVNYHFAQVVSGGYPMAFTNPFVLDRNGNGKFDAPGVAAGGAR